MHIIDLANAKWTIEACGDLTHVPPGARGRRFNARVPGCAHTDLIRAGVIGHPNIAFNEEACQWIGRTDWQYLCRFEAMPICMSCTRLDLVLDGLDTVAKIEMNGLRVGSAMNMHHLHRFDARELLRLGENELVISLRGPVAYVEEQERRLGTRPVNGDWTPYCHLRKMASNFQWDWGPKVATCGIWRAARIEAWNGARIVSVLPITGIRSDGSVDVHLEAMVEAADSSERLRVHGTLSRSDQRWPFECRETARDECFAVDLHIEKPELWWPHGHGRPALYDLELAVTRDDGTLASHSSRVGLRTTRLRTSSDEQGSAFTIEVNGVPIYCNGANWVPEGLFPEDQTPDVIRGRVRQAADANMNMLRVWGGGAYEQDAFYDACDEIGIMIWQDFMFACATYPEDDTYSALIWREAREAVSRLAHHPSIVLWCGGNENVLGYESWGWKLAMPRQQKWGERYYFDDLPRVVGELDPSRPYWPDSPHSAASRSPLHPNDPDHGDRHTWDAKVEGYREIVPRFCSEFGHQSPPCWATMKEAWGEDQLRLDSDAMRHRQRATGGNDVWFGEKVMGGRWREPRDFDEWLYQAHVLQARAMATGIEWMRANQPRSMGALFWQFNDAWAGHSWSCIDSAGRRKPLWYAVRRSFSPRAISFHPRGASVRLSIVNETTSPWRARVQLRRFHVDGRVLAEHETTIVAAAHSAQWINGIEEMVGLPTNPQVEYLAAEALFQVSRAFWFFDHDRTLRMPDASIRAEATRHGEEVHLMLRADNLVRDAVIAVDRVDPDAEIDDNLITMLPGEERLLRIRTKGDIDAATWIAPPVFRCTNEFSASSNPV